MPTKTTKDNIRQRFFDKVAIIPFHSCWEWVGVRNETNYGQFRWEGRLQMAHKISLFLVNIKIPKGKIVLHRCDNPGCVNPSHLRVGTYHDNNQDMADKKRHRLSRLTHCKRGHEFKLENLYIQKKYPKKRHCKLCIAFRYGRYHLD